MKAIVFIINENVVINEEINVNNMGEVQSIILRHKGGVLNIAVEGFGISLTDRYINICGKNYPLGTAESREFVIELAFRELQDMMG